MRFCVSYPAASFSSSASSALSAGPQLQALYRSVPHRTRTASSGSELSPPDLHRNAPEARMSEDIPDRMPERLSEEDTLDRMPERVSEYIMPEGMSE